MIHNDKSFPNIPFDLKDKASKTESNLVIENEKQLLENLTSMEKENYERIKEVYVNKDFIPLGDEAYWFYLTLQSYFPQAQESFHLDQFKSALAYATHFAELFSYLRMRKEEMKLLAETPMEELPLAWENYVVRKDDFAKSFYDSDTEGQKVYGRIMHHTIETAVKGMEQGWSFKELLDFLAKRRQFIAVTLRPIDKVSRVGEKRDFANSEPITSLINSNYSPIYGNVIKKFEESKAKGLQNGDSWLVRDNSCYGEDTFVFIGRLGGKDVRLSSLIDGQFNHMTVEENIQQVMDYVENVLYEKARANLSESETYECCGRIFWWICHAKPWSLGDPSIAETLFRAILLKNGIENLAWKKGVIPWVEAMSEPNVNKFAGNFRNLFEKIS